MYELQPADHVRCISDATHLPPRQVRAAIGLFDEGNTIPFVARYRKEMTGELDENQLREIAQRYEVEKNLYQRKVDVLRLLEAQGVLEDSAVARTLGQQVESAATLTEIDDLYRPYRPKKRTRASVAKEQGLEPLANWLFAADRRTPRMALEQEARRYLAPAKAVSSVSDALAGARDIIAERVADDADTRRQVRTMTIRKGSIRSVAVDADAETVYEQYYDAREAVHQVPPHRILAMNRGERDGALRVSIVAPQDEIVAQLLRRHIGMSGPPGGETVAAHIADAVSDAYKRLIAPAIEREIRADLTESAEGHAIAIFAENLRNLLLQPPLSGRRVLGVDPAYRTGCKLAAVDETGKLLDVAVIYPTPPQNQVVEAEKAVKSLLSRHDLNVIAIGNGTASRETETFIAACVHQFQDEVGRTVPYVMVSEAGASVYSASPLAGEEFPNLDVAERSAISIARRLQDPLAELVKIDPKSIGVGQYQHDLSEKRLDAELGAVVESTVNRIGVDVNTASPSLLSYVAGLNKTAARNIVDFRDHTGPFKSRTALAKVPRLGPKTLTQCVGFLRITDGDNLLDRTPIHPESYPVVERLLTHTGQTMAVVRDDAARRDWLRRVRAQDIADLADQLGVGLPTLSDVLDALEQPGRDARQDVPAPLLRTDVVKLEDLEIGMALTGTVRNVVDFGAFVDVGVKNDGLVHISELSDRFVKHPMDVVSIGDVVQVRVVQIDLQRGRLGLSMKTAKE